MKGILLAGGSATRSEAEDVRELVVLEEQEPQTPYPHLARSMSERMTRICCAATC